MSRSSLGGRKGGKVGVVENGDEDEEGGWPRSTGGIGVEVGVDVQQ